MEAQELEQTREALDEAVNRAVRAERQLALVRLEADAAYLSLEERDNELRLAHAQLEQQVNWQKSSV